MLLTSFNFLNLRDYAHFYTVSAGNISNVTTLLTSSFVFYTNNTAFNALAGSAGSDFDTLTSTLNFEQHVTGDKLCYGSLISQGIVYFNFKITRKN